MPHSLDSGSVVADHIDGLQAGRVVEAKEASASSTLHLALHTLTLTLCILNPTDERGLCVPRNLAMTGLYVLQSLDSGSVVAHDIDGMQVNKLILH